MRSATDPSRGVALLLVLGAVAAAACSPPAPEEPIELETVDVAPPIDAELSTEGDLKAVRRAAAVSGQVPGDVPADLPIFVPSSVVDFGGSSGGWSYVDLDATAAPDEVRSWLGKRLPAAGWKVGAIGDAMVEAHKGGQQARYRLTALAPGTRIRLEYTPR
jgi:hypothetical protein